MKFLVENNTFVGGNANGKPIMSFEAEGPFLSKMTELHMNGWLCLGPNLTNEQLASAISMLKQRMKRPA